MAQLGFAGGAFYQSNREDSKTVSSLLSGDEADLHLLLRLLLTAAQCILQSSA